MADPQNQPPASDTPASPDTTPAPKPLVTLTDDQFNTLVNASKGPSGDVDPARLEAVALQTGVTPDSIAKIINDGMAQGDVGGAVVKAQQALLGAMQIETRNREGKREVLALGSHPKLGAAFAEHRTGFERFLASKGLVYAQLADPGYAEDTFRYYLTNNTDWYDKQREAERKAIETDTRKKVEEELRLRHPTPASPSLSPGASTEGGGLRRLVTSTIGASEEPTENQAVIMSGLGFSEEKSKKAMKAQAAKTPFGTPLDFVPTRNEGGV